MLPEGSSHLRLVVQAHKEVMVPLLTQALQSAEAACPAGQAASLKVNTCRAPFGCCFAGPATAAPQMLRAT